ncbi:MAG: nucleotidyl transferase AbiEii/AbiGii toxin family protein [Coriobacteriia bacterium]|nr:nucleotidyl transferase AbiEii/AbiGii toxin family protein [Coriobacteriia bacterium]
MIPEATIKSLARRQGIDPAVIDRDHALGVVLWAMDSQSSLQDWVFKGGTCLRKCHFGDYRFSEDLDFTVTGRLGGATARVAIASCASAAASQGIQLMLDEMRVEVMDDDHGRESIEIKVPYRGALRMGSAQNVQFHLCADEDLAFEPVILPLLHPYADASGLECQVRAYALEEILTEKLRAVAGQRRHAVARDIYDIASLVRRGADADAALSALPRKARYKGVDLSDAAARFHAREVEYEASWDRTLAYLVVDDLRFRDAFSIAADLLGRL